MLYTPGNQVSGVYVIPSASRILDYLPEMGIAPELADEQGIATLVMFEGPYTAQWVGEDGAPAVVTDVVCVLTASGARHIYYDVSREGFRAP